MISTSNTKGIPKYLYRGSHKFIQSTGGKPITDGIYNWIPLPLNGSGNTAKKGHFINLYNVEINSPFLTNMTTSKSPSVNQYLQPVYPIKVPYLQYANNVPRINQ
jgi:hypothetical protein